jgi:hypothetical protein
LSSTFVTTTPLASAVSENFWRRASEISERDRPREAILPSFAGGGVAWPEPSGAGRSAPGQLPSTTWRHCTVADDATSTFLLIGVSATMRGKVRMASFPCRRISQERRAAWARLLGRAAM